MENKITVVHVRRGSKVLIISQKTWRHRRQCIFMHLIRYSATVKSVTRTAAKDELRGGSRSQRCWLPLKWRQVSGHHEGEVIRSKRFCSTFRRLRFLIRCFLPWDWNDCCYGLKKAKRKTFEMVFGKTFGIYNQGAERWRKPLLLFDAVFFRLEHLGMVFKAWNGLKTAIRNFERILVCNF